jgi:molybdate transport system substrate-binding protein
MPGGRDAASALRGIASMATRRVLAALAGAYERHAGQQVAVESVGGVDAARRVRAGEPFDFVVLAQGAIDELAGSGHVIAASRVELAASSIALAVREGCVHPDVGSETALRQALLVARSIGWSTGPSGAQLVRLLERWGIAAQVAPRLVQAPPGVPVAALVARGEAELGFQQRSEIVGVAGVELVAPLPAALNLVTVFAGAVCRTAARPSAAAALLAFCAAPQADAQWRGAGMEPAREAAPPAAGDAG